MAAASTAGFAVAAVLVVVAVAAASTAGFAVAAVLAAAAAAASTAGFAVAAVLVAAAVAASMAGFAVAAVLAAALPEDCFFDLVTLVCAVRRVLHFPYALRLQVPVSF